MVYTLEEIARRVRPVAEKYRLRAVYVFGSYARGEAREDSDVDLIIEFSAPITLMTISKLRCELEEVLGVGVGIIHGPIRSTDMIEIGKTVELYQA